MPEAGVADALAVDALNIDARVTLCDVQRLGGTLSGVAQPSLRGALTTYAQGEGLGLEVAFPEPTLNRVSCGCTPLYQQPSRRSETVSEVGFGEAVQVYDAQAGFVRVAAVRDGYLGWVSAEALGPLPEPSHRFAPLRGHLYTGPDVAAERVLRIAYGAPLRVLRETDVWSEVALPNGSGYVPSRALTALDTRPKPTPEAVVAFALRFLETPYLWGGVSAWGLDCSGLIQTVYSAFGLTLPRDSDQQAQCGEAALPADLRAADLLFFPGHVALALDGDRFVHANAQHMCVSVDAFSDADYGERLRGALTGAMRLLP